mmetsp:Transcript_39356/g.77093  ORF Transcript_39356/g.77093 Transcript_39356/m.77093 type:complete len:235 (-) Transcript_39356:145-849(-)
MRLLCQDGEGAVCKAGGQGVGLGCLAEWLPDGPVGRETGQPARGGSALARAAEGDARAAPRRGAGAGGALDRRVDVYRAAQGGQGASRHRVRHGLPVCERGAGQDAAAELDGRPQLALSAQTTAHHRHGNDGEHGPAAKRHGHLAAEASAQGARVRGLQGRPVPRGDSRVHWLKAPHPPLHVLPRQNRDVPAAAARSQERILLRRGDGVARRHSRQAPLALHHGGQLGASGAGY